ALEGARFHEVVRSHLEEDLLGDPDVVGVLLGRDPEPAAVGPGPAVVREEVEVRDDLVLVASGRAGPSFIAGLAQELQVVGRLVLLDPRLVADAGDRLIDVGAREADDDGGHGPSGTPTLSHRRPPGRFGIITAVGRRTLLKARNRPPGRGP